MFKNPQLLNLLFAIPLIALLLLFCLKKKKRDLFKFVSNDMFDKVSNINLRIFSVKNILILICFFLLIIALARPEYGVKTTVVSKKAATIVLVMDVSKSMLAQDLKPNRLEKSKSALSNLIAGFKGNKIGIVVFAGTAFWQCPITIDVFAANNFLRAISVDIMPLGGTKIAKALDLALNETADVPEGAKAIILVTDGEDDDSGLSILVEKAKKYKTKIYTVGIGNNEGTTIPISDENGNIVNLSDSKGETVITKLDEDTLQYLANETGGQYINLAEDNNGIFKILQIANALDKVKDEASKETRRDEQYQIFLFITLILFLFVVYLPVYKRDKKYE